MLQETDDQPRGAPLGRRALGPLLGTLASLALLGCAATELAEESAQEPTPALAPPTELGNGVRAWGSMREALRMGRSHARAVPVAEVSGLDIGVGALAELVGEVTIVDGRAYVSEGTGAAVGRTRPATAEDRATLLVTARVSAWEEQALDPCRDLADLERQLLAILTERGLDTTRPIPLRVRGRAAGLDLHVIAGDCPVANPDGAPPWRHEAAGVDVELVGFLVEGAAGRLTHHTGITHLHALAGEVSGHLEDVSLEAGATLMLPSSPELEVFSGEDE